MFWRNIVSSGLRIHRTRCKSIPARWAHQLMNNHEADMIKEFRMPRRELVEAALLMALLRHGAISGDFREGELRVEEIIAEFSLASRQRSAMLARSHHKGNRVIPFGSGRHPLPPAVRVQPPPASIGAPRYHIPQRGERHYPATVFRIWQIQRRRNWRIALFLLT